MRKAIIIYITSALLFVPTLLYAQGTGSFADLVGTIIGVLINSLAALFISVAALVFFYGMANYIMGLRQGDPNKAKNGNQFIIWSLTALFVMFSIYGIIKFGQGFIFDGKDTNTITIPDFKSN